MKLNVGCGRNILEGWTNLDSKKGPGVDIVENLDRPLLGICTESVDEFLLSHVLEHIKRPLDALEELWRVAKPGAKMTVRVPYGSSNDAYEDPTHVRQYFTGSFAYFAQPTYWRADYGYRGDWQPRHVVLSLDARRYWNMSREQMYGEITGYRNVVLEMVCELEAIKPRRAQDKSLQEAPTVSIHLVDEHGKFVLEV